MKWSIHQLEMYEGQVIPIDQTIDLASLKDRAKDVRDVSPVRVTGTLQVEDEIASFTLHLEGELTVPCTRTWEDAQWPFALDSFEQFSWNEWKADPEEGIQEVSEHYLDLRPTLEDIIIVSIPMQVYSEKAKELSFAEGQGWTYMTKDVYEELLAEAEEEEQSVDPRLAKLAKLLDSDQDK